MCQLVSMSFYVLHKNMQSSTYKEVSHKLYVLIQAQYYELVSIKWSSNFEAIIGMNYLY